MEPPHKRPRLSIFADELPSAELDSARFQNDRFLKGRFEAIFQKYERDFSGIGDEVDLSTGEIVVDNGHLAGLDEDADTRSEADESVGEPSPQSVRYAPTPGTRKPITNGRVMLRAMTVAPDRGDAYFAEHQAEEVIESIETIAENAAKEAEGAHGDEPLSEDDNDDDEVTDCDAGRTPDPRIESEVPTTTLVATDTPPPDIERSRGLSEAVSDNDSLFDVDMDRGSSPDSLFEQPTAASSATPHEELRPPRSFIDELGDLDADAIIERFGAEAGQEILDLIQRRDKAELHIERAWRIPVQIDTIEIASASLPTPDSDTTLELAKHRSPKQGTSLWNSGLQEARRLERHQERSMRMIRAESEDPLQEGFVDRGDIELRMASISLDRATRLVNRGMCPYCKEQFYGMSPVLEHFAEILSRPETSDGDDTTHPHDEIEALLSCHNEIDRIAGHGYADAEELLADDSNDRLVLDSVEEDDLAIQDMHQSSHDDAEDSDDDLFMDAGYIHSDEVNLKLESNIFGSSAASQTRPFTVMPAIRQKSLEIPESDDDAGSEIYDPGFRYKGPSYRQRRRKSSSYQQPLSEDNPALSDGKTTDEVAHEHPPFRETADPFDRNGSQNYRGRRTDKRSLLSLRPRRAIPRVIESIEHHSPLRKRKYTKRKPTEISNAASGQGLPTKSRKNHEHVTGNSTSSSVDAVETSLPSQSALQRRTTLSWQAYEAVEPDSIEAMILALEDRTSPHVSQSPEFEVNVANRDTTDPSARRQLHHIHSPSLMYDDNDTATDDAFDLDVTAERATTEPVYHFNVEDFKGLVLMHEREGQSLESVGDMLSDHYYNYRLRIDPLLATEDDPVWHRTDDMLLVQLSLNPETLMETIKRRLPHKTHHEIGNRLAERWLVEAQAAQDTTKPEDAVAPMRFKKERPVQIFELGNAEAMLEDYLDQTPPRGRKRKLDPVKNRVCRALSPSGTWRGCGKVFSQRSAVYRHWKDTQRACFQPNFDRTREMAPSKKRKATKENGTPCRSTSPGGSVYGCGEHFLHKSSLYRHWRTNAGKKCRPEQCRPSTADASDLAEVSVAGGEDATRTSVSAELTQGEADPIQHVSDPSDLLEADKNPPAVESEPTEAGRIDGGLENAGASLKQVPRTELLSPESATQNLIATQLDRDEASKMALDERAAIEARSESPVRRDSPRGRSEPAEHEPIRSEQRLSLPP